jgi:hypothetical protein
LIDLHTDLSKIIGHLFAWVEFTDMDKILLVGTLINHRLGVLAMTDLFNDHFDLDDWQLDTNIDPDFDDITDNLDLDYNVSPEQDWLQFDLDGQDALQITSHQYDFESIASHWNDNLIDLNHGNTSLHYDLTSSNDDLNWQQLDRNLVDWHGNSIDPNLWNASSDYDYSFKPENYNWQQPDQNLANWYDPSISSDNCNSIPCDDFTTTTWQQPEQNLVAWNDNAVDPSIWNTNFNHDVLPNDGRHSQFPHSEIHHSQLRSGNSSEIDRYQSLFNPENGTIGSNICNSGTMRSGNSFQVKAALLPFCLQIDNYSVTHGGYHSDHQHLIDVIEKASKDPYFSSMSLDPDRPFHLRDLITHGYENDLSSAAAQNVMLERFEALWKIDKNLAGAVVKDIPEPFQTTFITFLGGSHGFNYASYRLSNSGWEIK